MIFYYGILSCGKQKMEPLALKIYMMFLTEGKSNRISGFMSFGILGVFSGAGNSWTTASLLKLRVRGWLQILALCLIFCSPNSYYWRFKYITLAASSVKCSWSGTSATYLGCRGTNKQTVSVIFSANDANFVSISCMYWHSTRCCSCVRESYCANEFVCVCVLNYVSIFLVILGR